MGLMAPGPWPSATRIFAAPAEKKPSKIWKKRTKKIHPVVEKSKKKPKRSLEDTGDRTEETEAIVEIKEAIEQDVSAEIGDATEIEDVEAIFEIIEDE